MVKYTVLISSFAVVMMLSQTDEIKARVVVCGWYRSVSAECRRGSVRPVAVGVLLQRDGGPLRAVRVGRLCRQCQQIPLVGRLRAPLPPQEQHSTSAHRSTRRSVLTAQLSLRKRATCTRRCFLKTRTLCVELSSRFHV